MNDAVVQDVHYGAKSRDDSDKPKFTDDDFGELINPNIVQSPPQVTVLTNKKAIQCKGNSSPANRSQMGQELIPSKQI